MTGDDTRKFDLSVKIKGLEWDLAQLISWSRNREADRKAIKALEEALDRYRKELEELG